MDSVKDVHVELARIQKEIQGHLGLDSDSLVFEYGYKDSKTKLQEWAQARGFPLPSYAMVGRSGPDHQPVFTIEAKVDGQGVALADGTNKRLAEQAAALNLIEKLSA